MTCSISKSSFLSLCNGNKCAVVVVVCVIVVFVGEYVHDLKFFCEFHHHVRCHCEARSVTFNLSFTYGTFSKLKV